MVSQETDLKKDKTNPENFILGLTFVNFKTFASLTDMNKGNPDKFSVNLKRKSVCGLRSYLLEIIDF